MIKKKIHLLLQQQGLSPLQFDSETIWNDLRERTALNTSLDDLLEEEQEKSTNFDCFWEK